MNSILKPSNKQTFNRKGRRDFLKEFDRNIKDFQEIECLFIVHLFGESPSYVECYSDLLCRWIDTAKQLKRDKAFYLTELNHHYFEQMYKPLEVCRTYKTIHKFFNKLRSRL